MVFITTIIAAWFGATIGAFFSGYYSERGKRIATHADIENVLGELRSITRVAKDIEAAITHEVWRAQMCWQERKSAYSELMEYFDEAETCCSSIVYHLRDKDEENVTRAHELIAKIGFDGPLRVKFLRIERLIRIFGSEQANELLNEYTRSLGSAEDISELNIGFMKVARQMHYAIAQTRPKLIGVARQDLGVYSLTKPLC